VFATTDDVPTHSDGESNHDWSAVRFVLCDLDGVVWLSRHAIPGAPEAIARLRASGRRVMFVTNNSFSLLADQEDALAAIGIPAGGDVATSAQAAAFLVEAGETVLVCGGPGVYEAVSARGATPVAEGPANAVIVGFDRGFDYERMRVASEAVRNGSRLLATNDDATYPTPEGLIPGGGAILASVATASGIAPTIAGKPYAPMAALVRDRCGPGFSSGTAVMVGDRWSTDGLFAGALGCPFALVRTGVTPPGAPLDGVPALDLPDLAAVADVITGEPSSFAEFGR
jgi:HAD superfamily hydrolase (TIGR01450 family)